MINKVKNIFAQSLIYKNYKIYLIYTAFIFIFYAPVLLQKYVFFDDYATMGNSITHTNDFFEWDIYSGRFIYAFLRVFVQPYLSSIASFTWLRFFSVIWTLFFCIFLHTFLTKRTQITSKFFVFFTPLFLAILPSFIVFNAWATCFPYTFALVLTGIAYTSTFNTDQTTSWYKVLLGLILLICSFLIYQPVGMAFIFFVFLSSCLDNRKVNYSNIIISIIMLGMAMVASFVAAKIIPQILYGKTLSRTEIANSFINKLCWFFNEVLKNTISNYHLTFNIPYIILSSLVFLIGLFFITKQQNGKIKLLISSASIFIVVFPNLIIKENWAASRVCIGIALIITTILFYGLINIIEKTRLYKFGNILIISILIIFSLHTQNYMYKGFILSEQLQYQAITQEISSQIPKNYVGLIRFDTSTPYKNNFSPIRRYDEFGHYELIEEWSLRGMAASIKKEKKLNYQIEWNMVLSKNNPCVGQCIIINTSNITQNASPY